MSDIPTRLESRCQAWNLMSNLHTDLHAMSAIYTLNYEVVMESGTSCNSFFTHVTKFVQITYFIKSDWSNEHDLCLWLITIN